MLLGAVYVALYHGMGAVSMALHDIFATEQKGNASATLLFAIVPGRYVIDPSCDLDFRSEAIKRAKSRRASRHILVAAYASRE